MNVGDIVVASPGNPLHDSHHVYTHAICVSVDPLVFVSQDGGMLWTGLKADEVIALSQASPAASRNAFDRWEKESYVIKGKRFVDSVVSFAQQNKDNEAVSREGLFIALCERDRARDPAIIGQATNPLEVELSKARKLLAECLDSLRYVESLTPKLHGYGVRQARIEKVADYLEGEDLEE